MGGYRIRDMGKPWGEETKMSGKQPETGRGTKRNKGTPVNCRFLRKRDHGGERGKREKEEKREWAGKE